MLAASFYLPTVGSEVPEAGVTAETSSVTRVANSLRSERGRCPGDLCYIPGAETPATV